MKKVKISEVLALLKQGYTRWKMDEREPGKSIESKYGLTWNECKEVFSHPKIKGIRAKARTIEIVDDTEDTPAGVIHEQSAIIKEAPEPIAPKKPEENIFS